MRSALRLDVFVNVLLNRTSLVVDKAKRAFPNKHTCDGREALSEKQPAKKFQAVQHHSI